MCKNMTTTPFDQNRPSSGNTEKLEETLQFEATNALNFVKITGIRGVGWAVPGAACYQWVILPACGGPLAILQRW